MSIDRIPGSGKVTRDSVSQGLASPKTPPEAAVPLERNAKVDEVAKMYEKQFLHEMVKAMRGTVDFGAQKPSMAENIYRDQLDEQYVDSWGDNGGIGLGDLIYDQIMEKFFASPAGQELKAQGDKGIALTDRDVSRVMRVKSSAPNGQVPLRVEVKGADGGKPAKILAPWDGDVLSKTRLEGGKTALALSHGPKMRSTFVFQGVAGGEIRAGAHFSRGEQLAVLSPEIHSFLWNLHPQAEVQQGSLRRE